MPLFLVIFKNFTVNTVQLFFHIHTVYSSVAIRWGSELRRTLINIIIKQSVYPMDKLYSTMGPWQTYVDPQRRTRIRIKTTR
jgi:hypothetical protein